MQTDVHPEQALGARAFARLLAAADSLFVRWSNALRARSGVDTRDHDGARGGFRALLRLLASAPGPYPTGGSAQATEPLLPDTTPALTMQAYSCFRQTVVGFLEEHWELDLATRQAVHRLIDDEVERAVSALSVKAEAERAAMEEGFNVALEAAAMGTWELDLRTGQVRRSVRHAAIFGYDDALASWSPERLIEQIHPDDRARVVRVLAKARTTGALDFESRIVWPDGSVRWIRARGRGIRDDRGALVRLAGVVMDDTPRRLVECERERARAQAEVAAERLRIISDSVPALVAYVDVELRYLFSNTAYRRKLGLDTSEMLGRTVREVMGEEAFRRVASVWEEALTTRRPVRAENTLNPNGAKRMDVRLDLIPDVTPEGTLRGIVILAVDVTDAKRAEARLKEAVSHLEHERELRERFISMLSHDLRNPLSAAKVNAQALLRKVPEPEVLYRKGARIIDSLERADRMIRDLLDASALRAGSTLVLQRSPLELVAFGRQLLEELATLHGDRFVLRTDETELVGCWDGDALRRAIENLCGNAMKYGDSAHPVVVSISCHGPSAVLSVHNRGKAIPPEEQQTIFDSLRRGPSAQSSGKTGWGVGLSLVKGVVDAHGGSVQVESSPAQGTTFTVTLPLGGG
ncbi:sensor histidine kinase [Archangium sp.]|uniref:sensor histidine kinase n=1 Tax=Archangium sp. TaxID=1872627 RepID=UPI002D645B5C|nr:ATP-binding protein [Archangium sp.]HYO59906.1 ATP-binding protein [Archangium sp.]